MKKNLILLIITCLTMNFALAQNSNNTNDSAKLDSLTSTLEKINFNFDKSIIVPESLQIPARIIFGIQGEIPVQLLIVLLGIWIILFMLIVKILKFSPFFERGFVVWIAGFVITCLAAISGAILSMTIFFFSLGNLFGVLEKWPAVAIVVSLIIIGILFYGASILLKILKEKTELEEAEQSGRKVAKMTRTAKAIEEYSK